MKTTGQVKALFPALRAERKEAPGADLFRSGKGNRRPQKQNRRRLAAEVENGKCSLDRTQLLRHRVPVSRGAALESHPRFVDNARRDRCRCGKITELSGLLCRR